MRTVSIYRNARTPGRAFYMKGRVPGRQTLIFWGPLFIRIHPRSKKG
jgi:hypothetical protein